MEEKTKELRSILILLLRGMNFSKTRIMLTMAIIAAHQIEETICDWAIASIAAHYARAVVANSQPEQTSTIPVSL